MQHTGSNEWQPIVLYHIHNQEGFSKTLINGRGMIYFEDHFEDGFHFFKYLPQFKVAYQ